MAYIVAATLIVLVSSTLWVFLPHRRGIIAPAAAVLLVLLTAVSSIVIVDNAHTGVEKRFGRTVESAYAPGFHLVLPWAEVGNYTTLRREFAFVGDVITQDNNPLTVTVGFATRLNPAMAWRLQTTVGPDYFESLVKTAAQTAVRDGIAAFPWTRAVTSERGEVQVAIQRNFERVIAEQLVANGLSGHEAQAALTISPVQLRSALPDEKVLNAVAERQAAEQDLQRQAILTRIAAEEAVRRKNEGEGVSNLFDKLPAGFTSSEIAQVLSALADKTRADAMLKAVESNQVGSIIMNGDTASSVSHSFRAGGPRSEAAAAPESQ